MSNIENRAFDWFTPGRFALLLALLVFATFPQVVLGLQTFVSHDYGLFGYPLAHFQRERFWHGEIPFWNPYNNCGIPFLAQWNTMPLYAPVLIYLIFPLTWGLSFFCLLHLWFGGLGMYFLARKWTGNIFAGAFAGTAFAFNGMTLNLIMWPSHTATWSWMPWVVLAVGNALHKGGRNIFIAAICGTFQMLAGGPEIILFTWLVLVVLWIQQLVTNEIPWKTLWLFPFIVFLVAAMSATQLMPFFDFTAHSQRQAGYADLRWSMPGTGWVNYLFPMAFGHVRGEGIFVQTGQYWTSSYYLGIGTLWLALLGVWKARDRRVWLLTIITIFAVIFALGENTPILPALRKVFPQFGFVTYPVKYLLLVTFIAPLLAAYAVARMQQQTIQKQSIIVGALLFLLFGAALLWVCRSSSSSNDVHAVLINGLSRVIFLILTGAVLFVLTRRSESNLAKVAPVVLIFVAWLDVLTHEPSQNPTVSPSVYEINLAREKLAMNPQPDLGGSRAMVSPKAFMDFIHIALEDPKNNFLTKRLGYCANGNLLDSVPKVDGFFSLTPRVNDSLISLIYGATNDFPHLDDFISVSQITASDHVYNWQSRKTFLPLVTAGQKPIFLDDNKTLIALTETNFEGSKIVFLPPETKQFVTVTNQTEAHVLNSKFGIQDVEIEAEADAPSLVVISQTFYHDWRALVDGQSVALLRANYGFQAVQIPQGRHHVRLFYRDRAFEIGAFFSAVAWLACLFCLLRFKTSRSNA